MPAAKTLAVDIRDSVTFAKVKATNAAETAFTLPVATATKPANDGVVILRRQGSVPSRVKLMPYGQGANNDVFDMWVTGWERVVSGGITTWLPNRLVKLTCTLSAFVGIAGGAVVAADRFCDTITASMGISNVSYELYSPTDDTPGHVIMNTNGNELLEFTFDPTTNVPTMNCLWHRI